MDEECLRESGVMLIRANRALIRGSSMLPDGFKPFSFYLWGGPTSNASQTFSQHDDRIKGFELIYPAHDVRCQDNPLQDHHGTGGGELPGTDQDLQEQDPKYRKGRRECLLQ